MQQTQLRAENDRLEKTHFIEEQENRHRSEINIICKEKENLKTQLELQVSNLLIINFFIILFQIIYSDFFFLL